MKKILIIIISTLILLSCTSRKTDEKQNAQSEEIKPVTVQGEVLEYKTFKKYIEISARPEGITDVAVTSETNGRIVSVSKNIGDDIMKGEEIGRIDNADYVLRLKQSQASLSAAEANLEAAEIELKAAEKLFESKKISNTEMLRTRSNYKTASAGVEGAKAALEQSRKALENTKMLSPVTGKITDVSIKTGENTFTGSPVCTIVDTRKLRIKTGLGESDIAKLNKGMTVEIFHENLDSPITGQITGIGMKPYANSSNYPVEIIFDNPEDRIYPGYVVNCRILSSVIHNSIVISTDNIVNEPDGDYVYTAKNGTANKIRITTGLKHGDSVIVTSGLKTGDVLIVSGTDILEDGISVKVK